MQELAERELSTFRLLTRYALPYASSLLAGTIVLGVVFLTFSAIGSSPATIWKELAVPIMIGIVLVQTTFNQLQLARRLEELSHQLAEGNPNAVFRLSDQNEAIANIAKTARSDILFVNVNLIAILSSEAHVIIQGLERGLRVRILLVNPAVSPLSRLEGTMGKVELEAQYSLEQLRNLRLLTSKLPGSLEVGTIRFRTALSGLKSDEAVLVAFTSSSEAAGTRTPYFVVNWRSSRELYESFSAGFEQIWADAEMLHDHEENKRTK